MKNYILSLLLLFSIQSFAQTEKGNIILSGASSGNFSITRNINQSGSSVFTSSQSANINLSLGGGYFILDNFAIGLNLGWNRQVSAPNSIFSGKEENSVSNSVFAGPNFSYFFRSGSVLRPYILLGGGYGRQKFMPFNNSESVSTSNMINSNFEFGLAYFISDRVSLNGGINTVGTWSNNITNLIITPGPPADSEFRFRSLRLNIGFGFNFFFNRNKE